MRLREPVRSIKKIATFGLAKQVKQDHLRVCQAQVPYPSTVPQDNRITREGVIWSVIVRKNNQLLVL